MHTGAISLIETLSGLASGCVVVSLHPLGVLTTVDSEIIIIAVSFIRISMIKSLIAIDSGRPTFF